MYEASNTHISCFIRLGCNESAFHYKSFHNKVADLIRPLNSCSTLSLDLYLVSREATAVPVFFTLAIWEVLNIVLQMKLFRISPMDPPVIAGSRLRDTDYT